MTPRIVVLTGAQRAVLGELACDGADNSTIARRLGVSVDTVKSHMKAVMAAFGADNRAAVVADLLNRRAVVRTVTSRRCAEGERMSA